MRSLLWIGDAACDSGFAKATHYTLETLRKTWHVEVVGLNYRGDPDHNYPYKIWPAYVPGGDLFGVSRLRDLLGVNDDTRKRNPKIQPDLIVVQNDPWNFPAYLEALAPSKLPVVGLVAVDGLHCDGEALNGLTRAVFWTKFAEEEAKRGGMTIPSGVVPLGVDREIFKPMDKKEARRTLGLPEPVVNGFIVGNMNRNQPRKQLDLTIRYFGNWIKSHRITDAYLYLHVCPTGEQFCPVERAARYYGFNDSKENTRLIHVVPGIHRGFTEHGVNVTLNAMDVLCSTTLGEGFGLPALEAMAVRTATLLPRWSAYDEWADGAAALVPCSTTSMNPRGVIGGIPDESFFVNMLNRLYLSKYERDGLAEAGYRRACETRFDWKDIGEKVARELDLAAPWLAV